MLWKYLKNKMQPYLKQRICENDSAMTFEEIIIFAEGFAPKIKGAKCCAILCQSEMAASMVLLSCFAADVTALPLSQRYGELHCNKILDVISPDIIVTDQDGDFQIIHVKDSMYVAPDIHPAIIMCTSGTTGNPKGVMLSESNIISNVSDISTYFKIDNLDTILISRPLYHCAVLTGEFLVSLVKGCTIRFYSGKFNPTYVLELIEKYNITVFCGTPTLLKMMSRFKKNKKDYLKHIGISGESMSLEVGRQIAQAFPNAKKYHKYGLTEACPRVSYLAPDMFEKYSDCVGGPLPSVSLKIICSDGRCASVNEVGILWVKGDNVMLGYYNNPQKTSEVIKDGWLCTGDIALFNEEGLLKIKGRSDDMIIKAGMNIYPQEIENALKMDPRVYEVCAYGQNDEKLGMQILLNIAGDFSNIDEIKELCHSCLPSYQMPSKINLLNELPKSGSGKIIRRLSI